VCLQKVAAILEIAEKDSDHCGEEENTSLKMDVQ
jgi:hypothetical protein